MVGSSGVGAMERHRSAPELPTIAEQGLPDYESGTWYGIFAPANLPPAVLDRLGVEMKKALDDAKVREQILAQGVDPKASTPAEFRKLFRDEYQRWGAFIRKAGIKAD